MAINEAATSFSKIVSFSGGLDTPQSKTTYWFNEHAYTIVVSTNVPSYNSDCDRILWIKPHGTWTEISGLTGKALSCEVYWCGSDK